ncbi:MAG: NAD-dependent epimerase/dehydratase family protein [Parvibaculales bacterium]
MFKNFENKKVLIVGGAGFIGSNLVRQILEVPGTEVTLLDNLMSSETQNIPDDSRVRFIYGSACDPSVLKLVHDEYHFIYNLACFHGNQSSLFDPLKDHENNALPSLMVLEHIKGFQTLEKYVYAAAACAVAEKTYDTASETVEDQPVSLDHDTPYSISKIIGELYANFYAKEHGIHVVKARFSNAYGRHEVLGAGEWRGTPHTVWRNVVPTFIWKCLHGEPITLFNNGDATRDFIFAEDMARGLMLCALNGEQKGIYNLATGVESSISTLAETINDLCGSKSDVILKPAREWDNSGKRFASTKKASTVLGFEAEVSLQKGLEMTVGWTQENYDMISATIRKHDVMMRQGH